jgi:sarcosine/dimethylglycine N-methyltransferase
VLDLGAGYGGAARYLAGTYGCHVTCLNLSEVENERNRQMNAERGLEQLIDVVDGSFEDLPFEDHRFDVIWSQDSLLHSGDRARVLEEAVRVLRHGSQAIFTDPMANPSAKRADLEPILQRIQLDTLASPDFYRRELHRLGMRSVDFYDHSEQLAVHYQRVLKELERRETELEGRVNAEYRARMKAGLQHWIRGGEAGHLAWGIFHARY